MRKLGNMPVSAPLPLNGIFPMFVKRSKTLAYTKIPQKIENLSKLQPILDGLKQQNPHLRHWPPPKKRHTLFEQIRAEGSVIRSKTLPYTRLPQKTENLSKMAPGALFGTFCSIY